MKKDERIMKMEEDVRELIKLHKEIDETRVLLVKAGKKADEFTARSELYSRLEKVSGVKIPTLTPTTSGEDLLTREKTERAITKRGRTQKADFDFLFRRIRISFWNRRTS